MVQREMELAKKRQANPNTDSLKIVTVIPIHYNGETRTFIEADIYNETFNKTWAYKAVLIHIFLDGKEIRTLPAIPKGRSDYKPVDDSLYTRIPPGVTVGFCTTNPIIDPQTNNILSEADLKSRNARYVVQIVYTDATSQTTEQTVPQESKTDTLTLLSGCFSMRGACAITFSDKNNQKILADQGIDSCCVDVKNNKYEYIWKNGDIGNRDINSKFINKKFQITYQAESIADPITGDMVPGMKISKMILKK